MPGSLTLQLPLPPSCRCRLHPVLPGHPPPRSVPPVDVTWLRPGLPLLQPETPLGLLHLCLLLLRLPQRPNQPHIARRQLGHSSPGSHTCPHTPHSLARLRSLHKQSSRTQLVARPGQQPQQQQLLPQHRPRLQHRWQLATEMMVVSALLGLHSGISGRACCSIVPLQDSGSSDVPRHCSERAAGLGRAASVMAAAAASSLPAAQGQIDLRKAAAFRLL